MLYSEGFDCSWKSGFSSRFTSSIALDKNNPLPNKIYGYSGHVAIQIPSFADALNCAPADANYDEKGKWPTKLAESNFDGVTLENYNSQCGDDVLLSYSA